MFGDWCLLLLDFPFGADCVLTPLHFTTGCVWVFQRFRMPLLLAPADALRCVWSSLMVFCFEFPSSCSSSIICFLRFLLARCLLTSLHITFTSLGSSALCVGVAAAHFTTGCVWVFLRFHLPLLLAPADALR